MQQIFEQEVCGMPLNLQAEALHELQTHEPVSPGTLDHVLKRFQRYNYFCTSVELDRNYSIRDAANAKPAFDSMSSATGSGRHARNRLATGASFRNEVRISAKLLASEPIALARCQRVEGRAGMKHKL
jgi:hypothetical protein